MTCIRRFWVLVAREKVPQHFKPGPMSQRCAQIPNEIMTFCSGHQPFLVKEEEKKAVTSIHRPMGF